MGFHVQPGAKRTELAGSHGDLRKIRVAAPPVDGAANDELVRFLAELFGLPKRNVAVVGGHGSRRKTVEVLGIEAEEAARRLGI